MYKLELQDVTKGMQAPSTKVKKENVFMVIVE